MATEPALPQPDSGWKRPLAIGAGAGVLGGVGSAGVLALLKELGKLSLGEVLGLVIFPASITAFGVSLAVILITQAKINDDSNKIDRMLLELHREQLRELGAMRKRVMQIEFAPIVEEVERLGWAAEVDEDGATFTRADGEAQVVVDDPKKLPADLSALIPPTRPPEA